MNSLNSLKFADVTTVIGPDQRQREDFLQEGGLQPENNLSLNVEQGTDCGLQEERTVVLSSCIAIAGTAVERVSIHLTEKLTWDEDTSYVVKRKSTSMPLPPQVAKEIRHRVRDPTGLLQRPYTEPSDRTPRLAWELHCPQRLVWSAQRIS